MNRIVIIGGSGFIGRRICRAAVSAGYDVRSISRRGQPSDLSTEDVWANHVEWIAADLFDPADWRNSLVNCDAVIHSVGITREAPSEGVIFERTNGDSAIVAGLEAERVDVNSFVFISASAKPPGLSERYITAKRRAERSLSDLSFRDAILRPGPLYGEGNPHYPQAVSRLYEFIDRYNWLANRLGAGQPLPVDAVAITAFRAAVDASLDGILDIPTIYDYAADARNRC